MNSKFFFFGLMENETHLFLVEPSLLLNFLIKVLILSLEVLVLFLVVLTPAEQFFKLMLVVFFVQSQLFLEQFVLLAKLEFNLCEAVDVLLEFIKPLLGFE
jgi:hypothetical protein